MFKLFVTGDNHLCRQYARSPIKEVLKKSRIDSLRNTVRLAEQEECDYYIITGDLFDRVNNISIKDIGEIIEILESFNQTVLILPGNHDFYTGSEKLWKDFQNRASSSGNIILLNEYRTYRFGSGDDELVIYPAYCDSKHSKTNRLKWIAEKFEQSAAFNIGIAHGTIKGISPDLKEEYFPMELTELNAIPMDCWLIGHTHITYPFDLPYDQDISGYSIFNAGTHEQLDKNNNTEGNAFIVTLDRKSDIKNVYVRKLRTGNILYKDISYTAEAGDVRTLEQILTSITNGLPKRTIVDLEIKGTISQEDYELKDDCYKNVLGQFLYHTEKDDELVPEITLNKIRDEYSEFSLAAQFLEKLLDDPVEVQMAYGLLKKCSEASI